MIRSWLERRREHRRRVQDEADRLQREHGVAAYSHASMAIWDAGADWRLRDDVRREVALRQGIRPGLDNATRRWLDGH